MISLNKKLYISKNIITESFGARTGIFCKDVHSLDKSQYMEFVHTIIGYETGAFKNTS